MGSLTGQNNTENSASASNVDGGNSSASSYLNSADGLEADSIDIASSGEFTGLNTVNLAASAESTSGSLAESYANGGTEGAEIDGTTTIGGIGTITGQVDFGSSAASRNVTGAALSNVS